MKRSYSMAAVAMAIMMMTGIAVAGSVDIGLGRMDQAEFETLRQMVSGVHQPSVAVATEKPEETRIAEFNQRDVDAIRQAMSAGNDIQRSESPSVAKNGMVDIGTGSMATREFCNLNNLVASNGAGTRSGFAFICP